MKRKTLFWIVLFALLAAVSAAVACMHGGGTVAIITVDGQERDRIDLSAVAIGYEMTVETDWGWNTIRVEPGRIAVIDADCPGHDCVLQGDIDDGTVPIVCLPHRLVIRIEEP